MKRCFSALVPVALAAASFAAAQEPPQPPRPRIQAARFAIASAASKIKIDGVLDEEAWARATVIPLLYEWTPGDNIPPAIDTECLVTYDRDNFYVAFRAHDPEPGKIRAHLMDRDSSDTFIQDDHVMFIIDPFNDERRGFQFRANPLGVQADANFSESEGYEDFSWDAIWKSVGRIEDWGFAMEIAIPFNQLRFPTGGGVQTWGFSAERSWPRNVRHRISSCPRYRDVGCLLCQENKITGFEGITPGKNIELDPTLTAGRTDTRPDFPGGPMETGKARVDPGISARWGITPNIILNATVNPDFSQIEADIAQLDVNTRFALYYPEKRPFFLEGGDFFLTPLQAVFTRTVADPAGGFKVTGKSGKNAFGFFGAYDKINNLIFPSNQGSASASLDGDVASGVFRFRRDIGRNSTLGLLYTGRAGDGYYNHVLGFDGFLWLSRTTSVNFQALHSESEYPAEIGRAYGQPEGAFSGNGLTAGLQHISRNWMGNLTTMVLSPDFRTDNGFIPQVDVRGAEGQLFRQFWGDQDSWFTRIMIGPVVSAVESMHGRLTQKSLDMAAFYQGPLQSQVEIMFGPRKEFFQDVIYDLNQAVVRASIKPFSGAFFRVTGQFGDRLDYANARKADAFTLSPSIEYNFSRHFNFNLALAYERMALRGRQIYTANILQGNLVYNFNVRTFLRAIVQYRDISRNPDLYIAPIGRKSDTIFTQLLFSYKLNPQTVLFLGYSDNSLGLEGISMTRTDRTFFVKIGYAWTR